LDTELTKETSAEYLYDAKNRLSQVKPYALIEKYFYNDSNILLILEIKCQEGSLTCVDNYNSSGHITSLETIVIGLL
jgi:hypothetical protein